MVSASPFVLEHIAVCLYAVPFQIHLHEPIYRFRDWDPLVCPQLYLVDLDPCVPSLYVVGIPLEAAHLADPQPDPPQVQVHEPKMLRKPVQLFQDLIGDLLFHAPVMVQGKRLFQVIFPMEGDLPHILPGLEESIKMLQGHHLSVEGLRRQSLFLKPLEVSPKIRFCHVTCILRDLL